MTNPTPEDPDSLESLLSFLDKVDNRNFPNEIAQSDLTQTVFVHSGIYRNSDNKFMSDSSALNVEVSYTLSFKEVKNRLGTIVTNIEYVLNSARKLLVSEQSFPRKSFSRNIDISSESNAIEATLGSYSWDLNGPIIEFSKSKIVEQYYPKSQGYFDKVPDDKWSEIFGKMNKSWVDILNNHLSKPLLVVQRGAGIYLGKFKLPIEEGSIGFEFGGIKNYKEGSTRIVEFKYSGENAGFDVVSAEPSLSGFPAFYEFQRVNAVYALKPN